MSQPGRFFPQAYLPVGAAVLGLIVSAAAWAYHYYTGSHYLRSRATAAIAELFPDSIVSLRRVSLGSDGRLTIEAVRVVQPLARGMVETLSIGGILVENDPEQFSGGRWQVCRILLQEPELTVIRQPDGLWSLQRWNGKHGPSFGRSWPPIEVRGGRLRLVDPSRSTLARPVEIHSIHARLEPRGATESTLAAEGRTGRRATVRIHGRMSVAGGTFRLHARTAGLACDEVIGRLPAELADPLGQLQAQGGELSAEAELSRPSDRAGWGTCRGTAHWSGGMIRAAEVPRPITELSARARFGPDGIVLEQCRGRSGATCWSLSGSIGGLSTAAPLDLLGRADGLVIDPPLVEHLPGSLRSMVRRFQPRGPADLTVRLHCGGGRVRIESILAPRGLSATFDAFPYPLRGIVGRLTYRAESTRDQSGTLAVDVTARAGDQPVTIRGRINRPGPAAEMALDVQADDLAIDRAVLAALGPTVRPLVVPFRLEGQCQVDLHLRRSAGRNKPWRKSGTIRISAATECHELFPYPVDSISGVIEVEPDGCIFRDFTGRHGRVCVAARGRAELMSHGVRFGLTVLGRGVEFDQALHDALPPGSQRAFDLLQPGGRCDVRLDLGSRPGAPPSQSVRIGSRGCSIRCRTFPYPISGIMGTVRVAGGIARWGRLTGRHGGSALGVAGGRASELPGGGLHLELNGLWADPLVLDGDFRRAVPPEVRKLCERVESGGAMRMATELTVDSHGPAGAHEFSWDGALTVQGTALRAGVLWTNLAGRVTTAGSFRDRHLTVRGVMDLDSAALSGQPIERIQGQFEVRDRLLQIGRLRAGAMGGEVRGVVWVKVTDDPTFGLGLATPVQRPLDLRRFAAGRAGTAAALTGLAGGRMTVGGRALDPRSWVGSGSLEVRDARLGAPLPGLAVVRLLVPGGGAGFDGARAEGRIGGGAIALSSLIVSGRPISLQGSGQVGLDGSLQLTCRPVLGRGGSEVSPIRSMVRRLAAQLCAIQVHGTIGQPRVIPVPLPVLRRSGLQGARMAPDRLPAP